MSHDFHFKKRRGAWCTCKQWVGDVFWSRHYSRIMFLQHKETQ